MFKVSQIIRKTQEKSKETSTISMDFEERGKNDEMDENGTKWEKRRRRTAAGGGWTPAAVD